MSNHPEGGEEHPHPSHHQAVQGQAPLQGGEAGAFEDNSYSVLCGGVPAVGGREEVRGCGRGGEMGGQLVK